MYKLSQKALAALSAGLVISAFTVLSFGATSVRAQGAGDPEDDGGAGGTVCYYSGVAYSVGACVRSVCVSPNAQKCESDGRMEHMQFLLT